MRKGGMSLYDKEGQRKYLNQEERLQFYEATKNQPLEIRLFCQLLYYTGARIAEIHNLKTSSIDFSNKTVIIESLKKRQKGIFREIPLPSFLLDNLRCFSNEMDKDQPLWSFSLRTASRIVKKVMGEANIIGVRASARGLRHGFAVYSITKVPLTLVKRWLGHTALETTEIYLNVIGEEERKMAEKIW